MVYACSTYSLSAWATRSLALSHSRTCCTLSFSRYGWLREGGRERKGGRYYDIIYILRRNYLCKNIAKKKEEERDRVKGGETEKRKREKEWEREWEGGGRGGGREELLRGCKMSGIHQLRGLIQLTQSNCNRCSVSSIFTQETIKGVPTQSWIIT